VFFNIGLHGVNVVKLVSSLKLGHLRKCLGAKVSYLVIPRFFLEFDTLIENVRLDGRWRLIQDLICPLKNIRYQSFTLAKAKVTAIRDMHRHKRMHIDCSLAQPACLVLAE
jgi:hypothetical protein